METNTESLCCRDTNEVPDVLFEGKFLYVFRFVYFCDFPTKLFLFHISSY